MNKPVRKSYLDFVKRNLQAANRQMKKIINNLNTEYSQTRIYRLLLVYSKYFIHHVTPHFENWYSIITSLPVLPGKLDDTKLPKIEKHVRNIVFKICKQCEFVMDTNAKTGEPIPHILKEIGEKMSQNLLENEVLEFLLSCSNSSVLIDMRDYLKSYIEIPHMDYYPDKVWPAPCTFMPTNVFPKLGKKENDGKG